MVESSPTINRSELVSIAVQMLEELVAAEKLSNESSENLRKELEIDDDESVSQLL